jgi:type II secretory pathway component GspD/PulD (secretin)
LGRIPLLGPLAFRNRNQENEMAELVVFITPHIVEGDQLVTGDEKAFGGGVKAFRPYESMAEDASAQAAP